MSEKTKVWLRAAGIRAIKTAAQTAVGLIGTTVFIENISWVAILSASGLAAIVSTLTSVAGLPEVSAEVTTND